MKLLNKLTAKKEIEGLDGLRFIAVFIVILSHLIEVNFKEQAINLSSIGREGVLLFFTISGFIISHITLKEKDQTGKINVGRFYLKRVLKILPVLYFYLIFLIIFNSNLLISSNNLISSFFMYKNYLFTDYSPYTGHIWSLAIEEHFYLIFPILCFFLDRKSLSRIAVLLLFVSPLIRVLTLKFFPESRINIDIMTHCRLDSFSVGILIAIYFDNISNFVSRLNHKSFILSVLLILYLILLPLSRAFPPFKGYWLLFGMSLSLFMAGAIVTLTILLKQGVVYKTINSTVFRHLGIISYSLYMWQEFPIYYFTNPIISILLAYVFGLLSFLIIEIPFETLKKSILKRN